MKFKLYHFFHPEFCLQGKVQGPKKRVFKVVLPSWGAIIYRVKPNHITSFQQPVDTSVQVLCDTFSQCGLKRALQARRTRQLNHLRF